MSDPKNGAGADKLLRDADPSDGGAIQRLLDKPLSDDDLREYTRRVAKPLGLVDKDIVRLLIFRAGQERMALEAVGIHQVTRATRVHRIPHRSNAIIRGLCSLDGDLMLCADLVRLLELSDDDRDGRNGEQRWMIVLGDDQHRWVVEVDSIEGVTAVAAHTFRRPPITVDASLARYTTSLVPLDQGDAALLDLQRLVSGFQAALR